MPIHLSDANLAAPPAVATPAQGQSRQTCEPLKESSCVIRVAESKVFRSGRFGESTEHRLRPRVQRNQRLTEARCARAWATRTTSGFCGGSTRLPLDEGSSFGGFGTDARPWTSSMQSGAWQCSQEMSVDESTLASTARPVTRGVDSSRSWCPRRQAEDDLGSSARSWNPRRPMGEDLHASAEMKAALAQESGDVLLPDLDILDAPFELGDFGSRSSYDDKSHFPADPNMGLSPSPENGSAMTMETDDGILYPSCSGANRRLEEEEDFIAEEDGPDFGGSMSEDYQRRHPNNVHHNEYSDFEDEDPSPQSRNLPPHPNGDDFESSSSDGEGERSDSPNEGFGGDLHAGYDHGLPWVDDLGEDLE